MECRHGIRRHEVLDGVRNLETQDPCVDQTRSLNLSAGGPNPSKKSLNTQEVFGGIIGGQRCEKRAIPAAEVDLNWRFAAEDCFEIERGDAILRDDFWFTCYRDWRIRGQHP